MRESQSLPLGITRLIRLATFQTQESHQSLRHHGQQARRQQERLDPHVLQSGHGADCRIGVEGRQHQVASQRRLNRNFSGLEITDLPHHDHVGVLSKNGS